MSLAADALKKRSILIGLLLIAGAAIGIPVGWATGVPLKIVHVVDTTPSELREDLQEDYLRMAIDSFRVNRDPNLAVRRWDNLGDAASLMFERIQKDPAGIDPVVIVAYGEVIQAVKGTGTALPTSPPDSGKGAGISSILVPGAVAVLVLLGGATLLYFSRGFARRRTQFGQESIGEASAPTHDRERNRKTDFETLGVAAPITQNMTTYVMGDDLYDESFSIDTPAGDFLGEYGVGVSETIGIGEPKKVTALEIWLFDKNDIKTATKVLMSAHAFSDSTVRGRLEAKGELLQVESQKQVMLETETLQLLATVVDLQYGDGAMPASSYFERVTLEMAVWRKASR